MKSVLISIQPKWCELILNDKKTIEVRKTAPKLEMPFKCYIYCTKGEGTLGVYHKDAEVGRKAIYRGDLDFRKAIPNIAHIGNGKVIGEFVCDRIDSIFNVATTDWNLLCGSTHEYHKELVRQACLTEQEVHEYAKGRNTIYCWHISELKIYDKPKDLSSFKHCCGKTCSKCRYSSRNCNGTLECNNTVTASPQSWFYIGG